MENLSLNPAIREKINKLAKEDGVAPESLVQELVEMEDRRRHVHINTYLYGEGEKRFRCVRKECTEKLGLPSLVEEMELSN